MKIVLDTNVIVSALVFGGVPRQILELAEAREFDVFYSTAIQAEVRRVLLGKFGWSQSHLDEVWPVFWSIGQMVVSRHKVKAVVADPDDDRILECALAARADYVVSGDWHLLRLGLYLSIAIMSPRDFLEAYIAGEI